jgi:hypothetical protein
MSGGPVVDARPDGHGDVFARDMGAMIVHVQRESGLAHRTFIFRPWQVRLARAAMSRWTWVIATLAIVSWAFLAAAAVRIPLLNTRIAAMERDALRLDTLQQKLQELQARYEQVQTMLSRPARTPVDGVRRPADAKP